jgi:hypothetical protein
MAGQLSAIGAQACVNHIGGIVPPVIGASAPTWVPGLDWIDTAATPTLMAWNTSTWVAANTMGNYIALLTGDPTQSGPGGGYATSVANLVEDTTAGYARQAVTFAEPGNYSSGTTYTLGQQVFYDGYLYQCAVTTVSGTAPSGSFTSNASWTYLGSGYPAGIANTAALTWGPYTAAQSLPIQWAALVTCSSGSLGLLKYMWSLPEPQQVNTSQSITLPAGYLTLGQS